MHLFRWRRRSAVDTGEGNPPAWKPQPDFARAVDDAMRLLVYAAETGRPLDDATRNAILHAKAATNAGWDEATGAALLKALTELAADLHPVTAESLNESNGAYVKQTMGLLRWWAVILAIPIVLLSGLGFVTSSISSGIRADINTCNELVIKLRGELGSGALPKAGTPDTGFPSSLDEGDVVSQLQLYASDIRAIDARSRQLSWLVLYWKNDPFGRLREKAKLTTQPGETKAQGTTSTQSPAKNEGYAVGAPGKNEQKTAAECPDIDSLPANEKLRAKFQLPVGLPNMPCALDTLTNTYQDVRSFAQDVLDLVSVSYGAINTCLLPILYALLGTCAYLLRSFEEELRTLTFTPSSRANWARFLVAGIGGAVVGLFGNFSITDGASVSPLAIAFLVGYAVDVFFSFLEGLLKSFTKPKNGVAVKVSGA